MNTFESIQKYGGASVCDPVRVREHVEHTDPNIVVVSAPRWAEGGITDMLYQLEDYSVGAVHRGMNSLAREMYGAMLPDVVRQVLDPITTDIQHWNGRNWPVPALGEHWTARVYAPFLGRTCVDASEVIRFDDKDELDEAASTTLIRARFDPDERYVIGGFYGANWHGDRRLIGRNGSDVTPAIIAKALDAPECHIFSNVPGFMTRDPQLHDDAEIVDEMSYDEVAVAAERGCKLLHPDVARLLRTTAVTTVLSNTFAELGNRGTNIRAAGV